MGVKYCWAIVVEMIHMTWLIYGNVLYYAKENTCGDLNGFLTIMMYALLLIGYMHFLLYGVVFFIVLGFFYRRR